MGGCRCSFRKCTNSSYNSPDSHFFHYPVKDKDRCIEWIKRGNNPTFLALSAIKLKNKVVCDKHFSDASFMNYKRDRLVHNAIPTLSSLDSKANVDNIMDMSNASINFVIDQEKNANLDFTLPQSNTDDTKLIVTDRGISGLTFSESAAKIYAHNIPEVSTRFSDTSSNIIDLEIDKEHLSGWSDKIGMINQNESNHANKNMHSESFTASASDNECIYNIQIPDIKYVNKYAKRKRNESNAAQKDTKVVVYREVEKSEAKFEKPRNEPKERLSEHLLNNEVHKRAKITPAITKEQSFQSSTAIEKSELNTVIVHQDKVDTLKRNKDNTLDHRNIIKARSTKGLLKEMKALGKLSNITPSVTKEQLSQNTNTIEKAEPDIVVITRNEIVVDTLKSSKNATLKFNNKTTQPKHVLNEMSTVHKISSIASTMSQEQLFQHNDATENSEADIVVVSEDKVKVDPLLSNKDNILKLRNKIKATEPKRLAAGNAVHKKSNIAPTMTKEQLFQGIRKYLSTSMEVLLRMELFGSPDRIWNSDEIELSMEFLNFGSDVYSYMTDELRWRLPSQVLVNKWKVDGPEENEVDS